MERHNGVTQRNPAKFSIDTTALPGNSHEIQQSLYAWRSSSLDCAATRELVLANPMAYHTPPDTHLAIIVENSVSQPCKTDDRWDFAFFGLKQGVSATPVLHAKCKKRGHVNVTGLFVCNLRARKTRPKIRSTST